MTDAMYREQAMSQPRTGARSGWAGWIAFASTMMILSGVLNAMYGFIAVLNDEWVVMGNRANLFLDISQWGWIHVILGVALMVAGAALASGNVLARTVGVLAAAANIVTNFLWLPAYPIWSVILITVNVLVIWALTAHGRDLEA